MSNHRTLSTSSVPPASTASTASTAAAMTTPSNLSQSQSRHLQHQPPTSTTNPQSQNQSQTQSQPPPQVSHAERTAKARTAFIASLKSAASNLDHGFVPRAKNIHANADALRSQERDLERDISGLKKCNDEMEDAVKGWTGQWGREMQNSDLNLGLGLRLGDHGGGDVAVGGSEEEELRGLGELERELVVLEEWMRIVEEEEEEEGVGRNEGGCLRGDGVGCKEREKGKGEGSPDVR